MSWFAYRALTSGGVLVDGRIEASDHALAASELRKMDLDVRELLAADPPPIERAGITADDLVFFNEQVASFARAGVPLDEGLAQLVRDIESPRLRKWIEALANETRAGVPLDQAFARHEGGLPVFYSEVIRAGIANGDLAATLLNLNQHLLFGQTLRRALWETLSYPLFVLIAAIGVLSFFFIRIIPQFEEIFRDFDTRLPAVTLALITVADAYPAMLILLATTVVLLVLIWVVLGFTARGQGIRQHVVIHLPWVQRLLRSAVLARFLRALAVAMQNGIDMPAALRLASRATGQKPLIDEAEALAQHVERGVSIYDASARGKLIPPLLGLCVQSAGGSGNAPSAVVRLAATYESRVEHTQAMVKSLLQPALILGLGLVMGFMIAGMFMPLVSLVQSMSGGGGGPGE